MNRSTYLFNRISAFTAFALLSLAILFAACAPAPIPVTGGASVDKPASAAQAKPNVDLGAGYRLVTNAQGVHIVAPETVVRPADKTYDLGAGYRLVVTSSGGEIVPPAHPNTYYKRQDLGAGYTLEINGDHAQIIAPASVQRSAAFSGAPARLAAPAASQSRTLDLGAGYQLVLNADGGMIVAPENPVKSQAPAEKKIDLGGGYWLILTPDGGQVVPEGSR